MNDADREIAELLKRNPQLRIKDGVQRPSGRLDSTEGAKVVSQYTNGKESGLERKFRRLWESLDCPPLQREFRFDEVRKWRFDFAHPGACLLYTSPSPRD